MLITTFKSNDFKTFVVAIVTIPKWYKMRHKFSHEHNASNVKTLQHSII